MSFFPSFQTFPPSFLLSSCLFSFSFLSLLAFFPLFHFLLSSLSSVIFSAVVLIFIPYFLSFFSGSFLPSFLYFIFLPFLSSQLSCLLFSSSFLYLHYLISLFCLSFFKVNYEASQINIDAKKERNRNSPQGMRARLFLKQSIVFIQLPAKPGLVQPLF